MRSVQVIRLFYNKLYGSRTTDGDSDPNLMFQCRADPDPAAVPHLDPGIKIFNIRQDILTKDCQLDSTRRYILILNSTVKILRNLIQLDD